MTGVRSGEVGPYERSGHKDGMGAPVRLTWAGQGSAKWARHRDGCHEEIWNS